MSAKFHERFEIEVGVAEARRRFTARIANLILARFIYGPFSVQETQRIKEYIASVLGDRYSHEYMDRLIGKADFLQHLQAVEAIYDFTAEDGTYQSPQQGSLKAIIDKIFAMTETDIGVRWHAGKFLPQGAPLLDEKLVNDPLRWLRSKGYANVVTPYEKGLGHLLQSTKNPALLADVVTDMYEALEALAKIVTGRSVDLSANAELFISKVKASESYKRLVKLYIDYANDFRHGKEQGKPRPTPSPAEVENFVYMTGTFIRLAIS